MKKISNLVTRAVLKEELGITNRELRGIIEKMDEKNRKYRDQILTGLDGVMKELETMREENTVGTHQIRELDVKVDNHETRIAKLEASMQ
ncbi:hypothetical protein M1146_01335 [Patescibacteria group bacterium]|nr:hypothetical protein [Patescibacteria group bacterium]